uniref:Uncharacterized protein n=1 Tax=Chrysemys picta bellii TaxID=8478 RepID=A0A8C3F0P9_CHRPI
MPQRKAKNLQGLWPICPGGKFLPDPKHGDQFHPVHASKDHNGKGPTGCYGYTPCPSQTLRYSLCPTIRQSPVLSSDKFSTQSECKTRNIFLLFMASWATITLKITNSSITHPLTSNPRSLLFIYTTSFIVLQGKVPVFLTPHLVTELIYFQKFAELCSLSTACRFLLSKGKISCISCT